MANGSKLVSDRRIAAGIFFVVLAAYIVTYNGAFKSNDERALFSGIDSFIKRGAFTTNQIYWDYTHVGVFTTAGECAASKSRPPPATCTPAASRFTIVSLSAERP